LPPSTPFLRWPDGRKHAHRVASENQPDVGVAVTPPNQALSEIEHAFWMIQAFDGDRAIAGFVIAVAREVGLGPRIESAAANGVRVANNVQIAADGDVFDANELGRRGPRDRGRDRW
jgi:hypothetical protein